MCDLAYRATPKFSLMKNDFIMYLVYHASSSFESPNCNRLNSFPLSLYPICDNIVEVMNMFRNGKGFF